ncbi:MAG: Com family DNA-binding transcriptional regulator [Burkholderiaceae bacterium]|nr:Com family DNA-binding transcriptional regulator [Burkholderiaceae bacterium]
MNEIRCGSCRRKLGEGVYVALSIKCPRCGVLNQFQSASSAFSSERQPSVKPLERSNDETRSFSNLHSTCSAKNQQHGPQPLAG